MDIPEQTIAERVARNQSTFRAANVPGHETCEVEGMTVAKVLERERYSLLEKIGRAAEIAEELDARSRANG